MLVLLRTTKKNFDQLFFRAKFIFSQTLFYCGVSAAKILPSSVSTQFQPQLRQHYIFLAIESDNILLDKQINDFGGLIFIVKFNGAFIRPPVPRNVFGTVKTSKAIAVKFVDDGSVAASVNLNLKTTLRVLIGSS